MLLIAALLLLPSSAIATAAMGNLAVHGPLGLPAGTRLAGEADLLYMGNPSGPIPLQGFELKAERLTVLLYMANRTEVAGPPLVGNASTQVSRTDATYTLHDVTVTLDGPTRSGFMGLVRYGAASFLDFTTGPAPLVEINDTTTYGHGVSSSQLASTLGAGPQDHSRYSPIFLHQVDGPHVSAKSPGDVVYQGDAEIKLLGVPLSFVARENTTYIETGDYADAQSTARVRFIRWVVLLAENATVTATSSSPWVVTAPEFDVDWVGAASFRSAGGELHVGGETLEFAPGEYARLEGALSARLSPTREGDDLIGLLEVTGDLRRSDVGATSYVASPRTGPSSGLFVLLVGVAIAAGSGAYYWHHRTSRSRRKPGIPPVTPSVAAEYYVGLAEESIQAEDHAKALHWIQLAREAVPGSADVVTTMAFILGELGQHEEALEAYAEASRLDPSDGEADVNAARLALRCGKPLEVVEELVVRALERSPEFVLDVEEDVEFQALAMRPLFRDALERAWWRWGGEQREGRFS